MLLACLMSLASTACGPCFEVTELCGDDKDDVGDMSTQLTWQRYADQDAEVHATACLLASTHRHQQLVAMFGG